MSLRARWLLFHAAVVLAVVLPGTSSAKAAGCAAADSSYSAAVKAAAAAYWRLAETSGIAACDSVGGATGTYTGGVTLGRPGLLSGDPGAAAGFDGATGFVAIPDTAALRFGSAMSTEAWVSLSALPAAGDNARVMDKKGSWLLRVTPTGAVEFGTFSGAVGRTLTSASGIVTTGSVYHLVGTYDGTTMRIYRNGTLVASKAATGALDNFNTALDLAAYTGGSRFLSGTLDDVAVYGRTLSAADVASHFSLGTATPANQPPTAPAALTATASDARVTLSWSPSSDTDLAGYRVFRRAPDGSWPATPLATTGAATTSFVDSPLTNGTGYVYRIVAFDQAGQASGASPEASANPAAPPTADPVVGAAGDVACAPTDPNYNGGIGTSTHCRQRAVSDLLFGAGLAAVLPLGDLQYDSGELANFQQVYDTTWGRVRSISHPAIGNHEYLTTGAAGYFDYFNGTGAASGPAGDRTKGYYSYDVGTWHMVVLNSNCSKVSCAAGSAQETWLKSDLAAHPSTCVLAYWHHPRFNSGTAGEATNTGPFWTDLYNAGADVVLNGHQHSYERFALQTPAAAADPAHGIREFIVGTGGESFATLGATKPNSEVRDNKTFGILKLTLHPSSYDWQFVKAAGTGTLADSGTQTCH